MYWLGPFEYQSKQALRDELKSYLRTTPLGRVSDKVAMQKLCLLLALHPDAQRKVGAGVDHFRIERNALGSGRCIRLVRNDGSEDTFSYKRCITGAPQSPHGKVCEALRFAVRSQLKAFRDSVSMPAKCAISGGDIVHLNDLHIDHEPPFWRLLDLFSQHHQIDLSLLETVGNGETLALVDVDVSRAFEAFHREHAHLQPSCKDANVEKGGRLTLL